MLNLQKSVNGEKSGFHIFELAMLRNFKDTIDYELKTSREHVIVGEVKTSTIAVNQQITKYMNSGLFEKCYEIHPSKSYSTDIKYGNISLDEKLELSIIEPKTSYIMPTDNTNLKKYFLWLNNYIKVILLANFDAQELNQYAFKHINKSISKASDLLALASVSQIEDLLKEIKGG